VAWNKACEGAGGSRFHYPGFKWLRYHSGVISSSFFAPPAHGPRAFQAYCRIIDSLKELFAADRPNRALCEFGGEVQRCRWSIGIAVQFIHRKNLFMSEYIAAKRTMAVMVCAVVLALVATCAAQDGRDQLAFSRAEHLRHGINASIWFAQNPGDYSAERLRSFTTADDIALMQRLGFDHVRLSIDAEPLVAAFARPDATSPFVTELDAAVKTMLDHKLAVIIDIHPETRYKATLRQGSDGVERFGMLWRSLAKHFANTDPNLVFFEIMNEPEQDDPYRWQGVQSFVAGQIRQIAPQHTIIATAARWDGLEDLLRLQPLGISNVIYTFHDYEPFAFTHQGATWTDITVQSLRGVPYPSSPEAVVGNLEQEPTLAGKFFVEQYGLGRWDAQRVDATLKFADMWSQQYHVPVYCGEFGVHIPVADPKMRAQWLHDMRVSLEHYKIGWAMWDYQTNFGIVSKKDGKAVPNPLVVDALGLNKNAQ
jgi:endoglucanase